MTQSANADSRRFIVRYGQGGHEHEYCVNIEGYSLNTEYIPDIIAGELEHLIDLHVLNRGSRLEIVADDIHTDEIVMALESMGLVHDPEGSFL